MSRRGEASYGLARDAQVSDYFYTILYALPSALSFLLLTGGLPPAIGAIACLVAAGAALFQTIDAA